MNRVSGLAKFACLFVLLACLPVVAQQHNMNMAMDAVKINITLSDYAFAVDGQAAADPLQLQAGQPYQLTFTNNSVTKIAHEVLFGRNPTQLTGGFAHTYSEPLLDNVPVMLTDPLDKDFMVNVPGLDQFQLGVGKQMTLEFTLPDDKVGNWEIGCFEFMSMDSSEDHPGPTHYDVGMHLPIVVSPAMPM